MKYQFVRQHSEEDCGAACLAAIAKHYQRTFALNRVREAIGTGQLGTTMLGLRQGAEALGFNARAVRASPELVNQIKKAPLPAIIHWKGKHWVVLYGQKGNKYVVADPAINIRYLSKKELVEGWANWVMLLVEPDSSRFYEQPNDKIGGFGRFFSRVWPYKGILGQALICIIIVGMLSLASPILMQILTDDVLVRGDMDMLREVGIAVLVMNIVSYSLRMVQSNLVAHFAQRLQLGLILEFGRQILRLPLKYYEARRSGEVVSRLEDIQKINQLVSQLVIAVPSQSAIALVSLGVMIFYSPILTLVAVGIAILMTGSTFVFLPSLQRKSRNLLILEAENQGVLVETFKGALTLKTTNAVPQFWEELQARFSRFANVSFGTIQIGIINNVFSGFVATNGNLALLWYGSSLVINQEITIGQLLAFTSMNRNLSSFISTVVSFVDEFTMVKTATQRLSEVTDATPETKDDEKKHYAKIPGDADIICENVTFHYSGRLNLLEDFNIRIPGGKVVALIGESGCGKSSVAKVITGLYAPQSGNIRIGDYNLKDLSLDCLREQIVLVPQDAHFWSRTIVENFRLAAPRASFEQMVLACKIAEADGFISKLPDKYQTILGEFGANISGGQRQRLAIARAIINNPPILILDESTGGLDPVSENRVLSQLFAFRKGKTTILISHRPRVISKADWIILLDQGQLKIQGTFEELRSQSGNHLDFLNP